MSRSGAAFEIARSTGVCAASGAPLISGSACMATLVEREGDDALVRLDYSIEAWESGARPPRLYSFWRCIVPDPAAKRRVFVDDGLLLNLFERLADDARPQRRAFRFVLALVLMRKRLVRSAGRRVENGVDLWLFRPKGASEGDPGPPIEVIDPRLSDERVRDVSDQLGEILNGNLE